MAGSGNRHIDFQAWSELAKRDPKAFERERSALIGEFIDSAPARQKERLRRLQWRVDTERDRAPNPLAACVRLYEMMWDSFAGPHGLAESLADLQRASPPRHRRAKILRFPG